MSTSTTERQSARERLLTAANDLFYAGGVHTVGIDKVIERAGVAKATLYSVFGSKDELIRAYLERRGEAWRRHMTGEVERRFLDPRHRLLGVFDVLADWYLTPGFHGCSFVNASAESPPGGPVEEATDEARAWVLDFFIGLSADAGAPDPRRLAEQLALLYHGATLSARMDRDPGAALVARAAAETLLDAALSSPAQAAGQAQPAD